MSPDEQRWQALGRSLRTARRHKANVAVCGRHYGPMAKRSYGSGSLVVKGEKWCGRWWVGDRRVKRVLGTARRPGSRDGLTRSQAERELRRRMESELPSVSRHDRPSVGDAGRRYVDHLEHVMERKRSTIQDYSGYMRRHFEPYFGDRPIDRIDADQITGYLRAKRGEGLTAKSVQNHLNFLHGIFAFAVKRGWATANPVALVDRPRGSRAKSQRLRFVQPEELDAVIRATPDDKLGAVERPLYLCGAMTGMRQGELLAARWVDIDWPARPGGCGWPTASPAASLALPSPATGGRFRWPTVWPRSSSATSNARGSRTTVISSSATRRLETCWTHRRYASVSPKR